jgi:hypothetical protein
MNAHEARSRSEPISEDMPLQLRVWHVERVGWWCLLVIVLLAVLGLFGKGPLSTAQVTSADGRLQVEYQRIARSGAPSQLLIDVQRAGERQLEIALAGDLLDSVSIQTIQPPPLRSATFSGSGLRLLTVADAQGRVRLRLDVRAEAIGRSGAVVSVDDQRVELSQLILP